MDATDYIGAIESCHKFLSTTYARFVQAYQGKPNQQLGNATASGDFVLLDIEDRDVGAAVSVVGGADVSETQREPEAHGDTEPQLAWAEVNAAYRRDAAKWLSTEPFGQIVLQRILLEPLRVLLSEQFRVAGEDFETEQQCAVAKAIATGSADSARRQFRLSISAMRYHEKLFNEQVGELWASGASFELIPHNCYTVAFRGLAFRCVSRLQCAAHQLLFHGHHLFPVRMFALLENPSLAGEMVDVPECMLDGWSRDMRRRHPTLTGDVFMGKLTLCALLQRKDISLIESKHASIRRLLMGASMHTHAQSSDDLSAGWLFLQRRNRGGVRDLPQSGCNRRRLVSLWHRSDARKVAADAAKGKKRATKTPRGGAWRAYCRLMSLGGRGKADFKRLAEEYKDAKAQNTATYQRAVNMAKAARRSAKLGTSTSSHFGPNSHAFQKVRRAQDVRNFCARVDYDPNNMDSLMRGVNDLRLKMGLSVKESIQMARAAARYSADKKRDEQSEALRALEKYLSQDGEQLVDDVQRALPDLREFTLRPVLAGSVACVEAHPTPTHDVTEACAVAQAASRSSNFHSALGKFWESLNTTLLAEDCPSIAVDDGAPSQCHAVGVCLCMGRGVRVGELGKQLDKHMRGLFAKGFERRKLLTNGGIVLQLVGGVEPDDGGVFFHIGLQYLSPFRPAIPHAPPEVL